jgi:hypothetical protein
MHVLSSRIKKWESAAYNGLYGLAVERVSGKRVDALCCITADRATATEEHGARAAASR